MRLTLRQLRIFVAVADRGTTIAASEALSLSQSATSNALNELESALDALLFDRIGKRLLINETGRALLPQARTLLDAAESIERQFVRVAGDPGAVVPARLRVAASTTIGNYVLPALVAGFRQEAPDVSVDVRIGNTGEAALFVAQLEADVGLIEGPCHEPELVAHPWIEDELVIVCAPDHPLARCAPRGRAPRASLAALREASWLLREQGSGTREAVEHLLLPHLHQLRSGMQCGGTEAIKQAAAAGLGVTCLSAAAVQDLVALHRLVVLDTPLARLTRRFYLVHHRRKQFSRSLAAFLGHCGRLLPG